MEIMRFTIIVPSLPFSLLYIIAIVFPCHFRSGKKLCDLQNLDCSHFLFLEGSINLVMDRVHRML